MAWMPFGGGPRSCAGIRFAYLQLKMVVAKLLRDFDFHPLSVPLKLVQGATIMPADGVHLSAKRRESAMSDTGLAGISGARRGSILAGLGGNGNGISAVEEWIANEARRQSVQEEGGKENGHAEVMNDSQVEEESKLIDQIFGCRNRRASNPKITVNSPSGRICRSGSLSENMKSEPDANQLRRDSIIQGIELLRRASLCKGWDLLLRNSNLELGTDGQLSRRSSVTSNMSNCEESNNHGFQVPSQQFQNSCSSQVLNQQIPTIEDSSYTRVRRVTRRGSALPVLESVGECMEVPSFTNCCRGLSDSDLLNRRRHSNGCIPLAHFVSVM